MQLKEYKQLIKLLENFPNLEIFIEEMYPNVHDEYPGSPIEWLPEFVCLAFEAFNISDFDYMLDKEVVEFNVDFKKYEVQIIVQDLAEEQ
ncbi:MAG: hypothetical protein ACRCWQ_06920 [Bacilli bacterium]